MLHGSGQGSDREGAPWRGSNDSRISRPGRKAARWPAKYTSPNPKKARPRAGDVGGAALLPPVGRPETARAAHEVPPLRPERISGCGEGPGPIAAETHSRGVPQSFRASGSKGYFRVRARSHHRESLREISGFGIRSAVPPFLSHRISRRALSEAVTRSFGSFSRTPRARPANSRRISTLRSTWGSSIASSSTPCMRRRPKSAGCSAV